MFSSIRPDGEGTGGNVQLTAEDVGIDNRAALDSASLGRGNAGSILLLARSRLTLNDGTIASDAVRDAGGQIQINSGTIILSGDSDIQTFVANGENDGGDITIIADALITLDDNRLRSRGSWRQYRPKPNHSL